LIRRDKFVELRDRWPGPSAVLTRHLEVAGGNRVCWFNAGNAKKPRFY